MEQWASGTRMGEPARGEWADRCGARRAAVEGERRARRRQVFYPLAWWLPAISGGEPVVGNGRVLTTVMRGKLMATSSLSRGGAGTRDDCHSDCFACRRRRVLSLAHAAARWPVATCPINQFPIGSWHFESQDGKMELVAPGMSARESGVSNRT